jgi:hypothetical protein
LRTIAIALFDDQIDSAAAMTFYKSVQPVPAAGGQVDAQQCERIAILHAGVGRIAGIARELDAQSIGAGRLHKTETTTAKRCPSISCRINRPRTTKGSNG